MTNRPEVCAPWRVDLTQRGNVNFDLTRDVVRTDELKPRDVFEHPHSGGLTLVEATHKGDRPGEVVLTVVPYDDPAAPPSKLTLQWNLPVQTFPPVATAHTDLAGDLQARLAQVPTRGPSHGPVQATRL